ncbi:HTH_Tnp_Tc3_2 domain-containing protein [Trichonephila clavipes]|nr:HTH_Tnp_Tc3_2 domain-containing protein [Trichonephila clavipes]
MLVGLLSRWCFLIGGCGRRQWAGRTVGFGGLRKIKSSSCKQTRSSYAIGRQESVSENSIRCAWCRFIVHWCAKIKDEVEKLAYQLNEEAERTERPIRRLSRIIGKLEEGRSVTSVAAEFGIAHSIVSRLWRQFQTTGTAIRGFSSGRPRGTTPADDRYIVLQTRRNRRQTAGEIARHTTQATGQPISRFTVARRLHGGGLFARRPVRCVTLTPDHRRRRFLWYREHRNWRDIEWGRVLFTDESRFSLSSDSHRILIWRERGSRNHPSNIIENGQVWRSRCSRFGRHHAW